ncbi:MAG TPA: LysM domain-containing protein [Leptolyngbyaceae cyanobacterium]
MFAPNSRYYNIPTTTLKVTDSAGINREIRYLRRRFIPESESAITLVEHSVIQGDRLDNITARYLGDPTQFWRLCDTNKVLNSQELTEEIGRIIKIALPFS